MSGERILKLELITHEDGKLEIDVDTDRTPAEVRTLLELVIAQIAPQDRAEEVGAFGATRRRR